jgi:hypothetical protein
MKIADHRLWSDAELVGILQAEAQRLHRRPRRDDFAVANIGRPHYRTFAYRFGSWTDALKAARLIGWAASWRDLAGSPRWGREELIRVLVTKARELRRLPIRDDFARASETAPHYRTFASAFGSWTAAVAAAGLTEQGISPRQLQVLHSPWSEAELIDYLRQMAGRLGRLPQPSDFRSGSPDQPSAAVVRTRFRTFTRALQAAGLLPPDPHHIRPLRWSNDDLLAILRSEAQRLGALPRSRNFAVAREGVPSHATFEKRFGSWTAAIAAAGLGAP